MRGENDAQPEIDEFVEWDTQRRERLMCLWNGMRGDIDAKPDELTFRLMCLSEAKTDAEKLKRVHENRKGCTRAEVGEYMWLWAEVEAIDW